MSDPLYARAKALAVAKIKQYGKPIVLRQLGDSASWDKVYDAATGRNTWRNKETNVVVTSDPTKLETSYNGYGLQDRYKTEAADNTSIQLGDIRLWAINIPEPKPGNLVTMNGKTRKVVTANPLQPGEEIIMWDLQLR